MDISGINSSLSSYYSQMASDQTSQDKLESAITKASNSDDDQDTLEACQEFEAYFVNEMLKEMRNTIPEDTLFEGSSSSEADTYQEMLDSEYATNISQGQGIGIAQMLYKQLTGEDIE